MRRRGQASRRAEEEEGLTAIRGRRAADGLPRGLVAATAAAVAVPVALKGGYPAAARGLFVALAGLALLAALLAGERAALAASRRPPVLVLWALAALSAASAAWTVAVPADAILWGLVIAGYAAVAVAAATLAVAPRGIVVLAGGIAVLAALGATWGIAAAALHAEPWAERIYRRWQPGGPFQYPPALALLQVAALPVLLRAMAGGRARAAALGAVGAALAVETFALSSSRFAAAAALTVAAIAVAAPEATVHAGRRRLAAALGVLAGVAVASRLVAGGTVAPSDDGGGVLRLAVLAASVLVTAGGWWGFARARWSEPVARPGGRRRRVAAVAALGLTAVAVLGALGGATVGASGPATSGFTHGRTDIWGEALRTWADRPLAGAGADAYLAASEPEQAGAAVRYAHSLPLELAAELGIAGLLLSLLLYATAAWALWRARGHPALWLLGPGVAGFLAFNLVDWTWHLAGAGAVWAAGLGGCLAACSSGRQEVRPRRRVPFLRRPDERRRLLPK